MVYGEFWLGRRGVYMEYPSQTRGRHFIDWWRVEGDLSIWIGALFVVTTRWGRTTKLPDIAD